MPQKKKPKTSLAINLINSRLVAHTQKQKNSKRHTQDLGDGYDYASFSVTEENDLTKFFLTAEMNNKQYRSERQNISLIDPTTVGVLDDDNLNKMRTLHEENLSFLRCPRRPAWIGNMTAEELEIMEYKKFIEWRRQLAQLSEEKGIIMTPFEKNLEFWRQFWRVLERSDLIVQIIDARNPLMFYCEDIFNYTKEISSNKEYALLINKSDYLTQKQREYWAHFFAQQGKIALFFSALDVTKNYKQKFKNVKEDSDESDDDENLSFSSSGKSTNDESIFENYENQDSMKKSNDVRSSEEEENLDLNNIEEYIKEGRLLNRKQLISILKTLHTKPETRYKSDFLSIGLVGYPNVGKSSTINALLECKKVSISATPGKTKHFQTIFLDNKELCLVDCPGLVFPNFVLSKAEMILNGILPIDQIKDYKPCINLLASIVPLRVFQANYSLVLPANDEIRQQEFLTADQLLNSYSLMKGFVTGRGLPDHAKSAKFLIKDFVNGHLLYCHAPPTVDQKTFQPYDDCQVKYLPKQITLYQKRIFSEGLSKDEFNNIYFKKIESHVRTKGINGIQSSFNDLNLNETLIKPWKVANKMKRNKREKLRRTYKYLDEH